MKRIVIILFLSLFINCEPKNDYKICEKLEKARCNHEKRCNPDFDLNECLDYYLEECRHRVLPVEVTPTDEEVKRCADSILNQECGKEKDPKELEECWFLVPPQDGGIKDTVEDSIFEIEDISKEDEVRD